jgi:FKBP-type peptidyl-prolyl cis-trans isomerase
MQDVVRFNYDGTFRDGTIFDTTADRVPARLPISRLMPCWQEALLGMREGEKARIVCPSDLAYGDTGYHPRGVKPGAVLVYEVELIEIVEEDQP